MTKKLEAHPGRDKIEATIITIRDERVILDSDLASLFGVQTKRLNEQVKRNAARFGEKYTFQLTKKEFDLLRSQSATSKKGRGGRRYPPWVFTEHGVVMAATILDSEKAVEASRFIVDVFVEVKRRLEKAQPYTALPPGSSDITSTPLDRLSNLGQGFGVRLETALQHVLDSVIDIKRQKTVREEAQNLISESIQHLKDRLQKQGLENEKIAAEVAKLLAEAEKEKAMAAKTQAEADALEFATIVKKLRLLLEVEKAMEHGRLDDFLGVLKELGE